MIDRELVELLRDKASQWCENGYPLAICDMAADAIERLSRGCETCRHRNAEWNYCGLTERSETIQITWADGLGSPGPYTRKDGIACSRLGHRCGAWEGRDGE